MPSKYDESGFDLTTGSDIGFENYFLMGDPFPPFTITDEEPEIFVDRRELMQELQDFIISMYKTGDSDAFVILGDYGDGKTHILKYLKKEINSAYANLASERAIAVYVRPGGSILDFVANFVISLGLGFLSQTVDEFIKPLLKERVQDEVEQPRLFGNKVIETKPKSGNLEIANERLESDILEDIGSNELLAVLVAIANRQHRLTAWSWLKGFPLTAQDRKKINVASPLKEDNALGVLTGLIKFLHRSGYKVVYILFDELEEVSELDDETRRYIYLNYLRQFIDDNQQGLAFIFGATVAGWDALRESAEALQRRIVYHRRLSKFELTDTFSLVEYYLSKERERYFKIANRSKEEVIQEIENRGANSRLYPYSERAVEKLQELAQSRAGYILKGLKMLMKSGYINGKYYETETDVLSVIPTPDVLESGE